MCDSGVMAAHGTTTAQSADADRRWLRGRARAWSLAFMVGEVIAGLLAHSLALLTDAGAHAHRCRGAGAWRSWRRGSPSARRGARSPTASRASTRCPVRRAGSPCCCWRSGSRSRRCSGWCIPARRARAEWSPSVALVGIVVNLVADAGCAGRADRGEPERARRASRIWSPTCGRSRRPLVAGVVVLTTGWTRADPIASLVVAAVMAWTGCAARPRCRAGVPRGRAARRRPAGARRGTGRASTASPRCTTCTCGRSARRVGVSAHVSSHRSTVMRSARDCARCSDGTASAT